MPDLLLRIRPRPGVVPADVRLRRALKMMLRAYGLRCLSIEEEKRKWTPRKQKQPCN
jgi:hypothetical protein